MDYYCTVTVLVIMGEHGHVICDTSLQHLYGHTPLYLHTYNSLVRSYHFCLPRTDQ